MTTMSLRLSRCAAAAES